VVNSVEAPEGFVGSFVGSDPADDGGGYPHWAHVDVARCLLGDSVVLLVFFLHFESDGYDMSPEVHCNWCNHCYTLGMPDPRPDMRCVQYLSEVHNKVPNEFEHQVEPLKSGTDIRDLNHHWMSNRYPQTSGRCQKWIQNIIRCQQWIQNIT
jgi:hypothetical protein